MFFYNSMSGVFKTGRGKYSLLESTPNNQEIHDDFQKMKAKATEIAAQNNKM